MPQCYGCWKQHPAVRLNQLRRERRWPHESATTKKALAGANQQGPNFSERQRNCKPKPESDKPKAPWRSAGRFVMVEQRGVVLSKLALSGFGIAMGGHQVALADWRGVMMTSSPVEENARAATNRDDPTGDRGESDCGGDRQLPAAQKSGREFLGTVPVAPGENALIQRQPRTWDVQMLWLRCAWLGVRFCHAAGGNHLPAGCSVVGQPGRHPR